MKTKWRTAERRQSFILWRLTRPKLSALLVLIDLIVMYIDAVRVETLSPTNQTENVYTCSIVSTWMSLRTFWWVPRSAFQ